MAVDDLLAYARAQRERFVDELKQFVAQPSVSAQPRHARDVRACADWLASHLRRIGLVDARVVATGGHPAVFASWRASGTRPALLLYGHYDVQPAEPLARWHSPPFAPTVRGEYLFGRGASDDKGQMFAFVKALEAFLRQRGGLPVDVLCLFEGEEEIGSPNLLGFVRRHRDALACDTAVMADASLATASRPAIVCGMRGALYLELRVEGPRHDLHSGTFGGIVHNPLQALCEIVAGLHNANGRIDVPGFYDSVRRWRANERTALARAGPSDARLLHDAETAVAWGEAGYSLYERLTLRPALTVNGIAGGYAGAGAKGVIPAEATAKLSFRLVPDQDPREIDRLVRQRIAQLAPRAVRVRLRTLSGARASLVDPRHPAIRAAAFACERAFGVAPALLRGGGTIPALHCFDATLGAPTVLFGFAPTDARLHAPDEKFHLPTFHKAIAAVIWWLEMMARESLRKSQQGAAATVPA